MPEDQVRVVERIAQNMFICAPHASQVAALAAMDCEDELQANLDVYRRNRALMLDGLPKAGFTNIAPPDGAFYVYADVSDLTDDSRAFAAEILDKAGVAVTPGAGFRPAAGAQDLAVFLCPVHRRHQRGSAPPKAVHGRTRCNHGTGLNRSQRGPDAIGCQTNDLGKT